MTKFTRSGFQSPRLKMPDTGSLGMPNLYPINSRNMSSGLAVRTLKNLHLVYFAHEKGLDVHIVTQAINSLLSLLMLPIERDAVS